MAADRNRENSKANVRAVSLKVGSHFNYQQENSKWTRNPVTMNLDLETVRQISI